MTIDEIRTYAKEMGLPEKRIASLIAELHPDDNGKLTPIESLEATAAINYAVETRKNISAILESTRAIRNQRVKTKKETSTKTATTTTYKTAVLIDAKELKKKLREIKEWFNANPSGEHDKLAQAVVKMCIDEIGKIKPADAVEVVRCKNCKHWDSKGVCDKHTEVNAVWMGADDFCSCGEKKNEDGN